MNLYYILIILLCCIIFPDHAEEVKDSNRTAEIITRTTPEVTGEDTAKAAAAVIAAGSATVIRADTATEGVIKADTAPVINPDTRTTEPTKAVTITTEGTPVVTKARRHINLQTCSTARVWTPATSQKGDIRMNTTTEATMPTIPGEARQEGGAPSTTEAAAIDTRFV